MYTITFNFPQGQNTIKVPDSKMSALMSAVNEKKIVQIEGDFVNTAYFIKAEKDKSENKHLQLEESDMTDEQRNKNLERLRRGKKKLGLLK